MVSRRGSRGLWEFCILCIWNLLAGRSSKRALQNLAFLPGPGLNQPRCFQRTMHKAVLHFLKLGMKRVPPLNLGEVCFFGSFFLNRSYFSIRMPFFHVKNAVHLLLLWFGVARFFVFPCSKFSRCFFSR